MNDLNPARESIRLARVVRQLVLLEARVEDLEDEACDAGDFEELARQLVEAWDRGSSELTIEGPGAQVADVRRLLRELRRLCAAQPRGAL